MNDKFPFFKQLNTKDCGPTCLKIITSYYGKNISRELLREKSSLGRDGVSMGGISEAAESIGLQSLVLQATYEMLLNDIPLPCIAYWRQRHFVVIYKIDKSNLFISDPAFGLIKYSKLDFLKGFLPPASQNTEDAEGIILVLEPTLAFKFQEESKEKIKSIRFLFPFLTPHKKLLI